MTLLGDSKTHISDIQMRKESYYKRNFICLMFEAFCFSFAYTMFAPENVLPVYVATLSDKPVYIAMISMLFYGINNVATLFSCVIGVNSKSPKWTSVIVCFFQRIGFFLIFLSTFWVGTNIQLALITFFISLTLYSASSGMSNPLFAQMISTSIHRNVSTFYGSYSMAGAASGVLASLVLTKCLASFEFPVSFRTVFLAGLITSLIATAVVSFGVREVTDDRIVEKIKLKDVFRMSSNILRTNKKFRNYTIVRVLLGLAEFAIPYYIISAASQAGRSADFVGIMAVVYLIAKMAGSFVLGRIGDRFGAIVILRCACICGVFAALFAVISINYLSSLIMYALLGIAVSGIVMSLNVACITYSKGVRTPIYAATIGILCAPLYILSSLGGAAIVSRFSYQTVFIVAMVVYMVSVILTFKLKSDQD